MHITLLRSLTALALRAAPSISLALCALLALGCAESRSALDDAAPPDTGFTPLLDAGRDLARPDLGTPDACTPYVAPSCAQDITGLLVDQPYTHLNAIENTAFSTFIGFTLMGPDARGCSVPALRFQRYAPYEGTQDVTVNAPDGAGVISFPGEVRIGAYESSYEPRPDGTYGFVSGTLSLRFPSGHQFMPFDVPICALTSSP